MAEKMLVATTDVPKTEGVLYWVKANEEGFLEIWASLLSRKGRAKKKKIRNEIPPRKELE